MSLPTRVCLAMALAWAGGFGLSGPAAIELPLLAIAVALGWWLGPIEDRQPSGGSRIVVMLALALLLGLLARALGRVVIATPAALWSVPLIGLAMAFGGRRFVTPGMIGLVVVAALLGASFEAAGPQAQGRVDSTPILGVHPRQAVAVRIDGFGPHDIIVDDYVDPLGGQGYDPTSWAARLEAELHAIAEHHYATGPARARVAFGEATVRVREAMVPPLEREHYPSLLGIEVRSGTIGEGSTVEFGCPGQPLDPRRDLAETASGRSCPRKYLVDGSTGLGLASRFAGHTRVIGRDRARLAYALGWPSGDPRIDRRLLVLESGIWLLALVLGGWLIGRRRELGDPARGVIGMIVFACVSLLLLALWVLPGDSAVERGGPTLLAILLVSIPTQTEPKNELGLACALLLALLAAAPLAGRGDVVELVAIARDGLLELGLGWPLASALAGSLATLPLMIGVGISAGALIQRSAGSEPRHVWISLGLALVCGLGLALRKPVEDLPLLQGAAAVLVLGLFRPRSRTRRWVLALACAAAAAAPILEGDARSPVALGVLGLAVLLCLALALADPGSREGRSSAA